MEIMTSTAEQRGTVTNHSEILQTIADEVSSATQRAYRQAMKGLLAFYEEQGYTLYPVQQDGYLDQGRYLEQVLSYLQHLASAGRSYSTVNKTLAAVKHYAGYENTLAAAALLTKPAKAFLEGVARQHKTHSVKKAEALSLSQIEALHAELREQGDMRAVRDRALLAVGIASALRSQNLGELTLADVRQAISIDGFVVSVRFSKTDQTGEGYFIPVKRARAAVDPVEALQQWLSVLAAYGFDRRTTPEFPLFPNIRGRKALQSTQMSNPNITITEVLRARLVDAGAASAGQAVAYSSHSLRATFITLSSQAGVQEGDIARISGHSNLRTLRSYDRSSVERFAQVDYLG
ncbi:tyrosine-type recombinase/integrase [Curtobacterium flaccumfaciens]|uniref:tyrosine-type recombinase/integrase n=1 Tax=Curtobacterium flaccumfaciens TaxID=2035 RepID=UPI00387A5B4D